jgi:polar amino acid transport system permease protein
MIPHGIEVLWDQRDALLSGFATTLVIAAVSAVCAGLVGLLLFALLIARVRAVALMLAWLIDLMRCVPFMLFCYLIYYGLPSFGIVIDNLAAGIIALTIYNAAYIAELLRGSYEALPSEGIEGRTGLRLPWLAAAPAHHPAAGSAVIGAYARAPDDAAILGVELDGREGRANRAENGGGAAMTWRMPWRKR